MLPRRRWLAAAMCAAPLMAACSEQEQGVAFEPELAATVTHAGRLPVYNHGVDRPAPARPCMFSQRHRQFDFWLGEWTTVAVATGNPTPNSRIESRLDGCLVHETWGGGGRSLNAYDRETGMWHQTWVSPTDFGHLRMAGNFEDGIMSLSGVRTQPNGVQWFDDYTWTPEPGGTVVQAGRLRVPAATLDLQFAFRYSPAENVVIPPPPVTAFCQPGGRSAVIREIDFWLGSWRVVRENGDPIGTSEVRSDQSGCLTEENFTTDRGYAAISFLYFDFVESTFYRTYVDSEGERVEVRGQLEDGALVLTGTEKPGPGVKEFLARMILEPVTPDLVRQQWDVSSDGGITWTTDLVLLYQRI